jgi:hypothetical protein
MQRNRRDAKENQRKKMLLFGSLGVVKFWRFMVIFLGFLAIFLHVAGHEHAPLAGFCSFFLE